MVNVVNKMANKANPGRPELVVIKPDSPLKYAPMFVKAEKQRFPASTSIATSSRSMGDNPAPMHIMHSVTASSVWSMKKPYTGLCVLRTRASVPSRLSPYQLITKPSDDSQSHFTL